MTINRCPDCAVHPGQPHADGCDVARCADCGHQFITCDCDGSEPLPWSGEWPGVAEAREFGWYAYLHPARGWVRCAADHPGAQPDLNRLYIDATWSRTAGRFVWEPDDDR